MTTAEIVAILSRLTAERDALNAQIAIIRNQLYGARRAEWLAADRLARPLAENEREEVEDGRRNIWTLDRVTPIRRVITAHEETRHRQTTGDTYSWTRRHVLAPGDLRYARIASLFGVTP